MEKFDFTTFKKFRHDDPHVPTGFWFPTFMEPFQETFYKSGVNTFHSFLKKHYQCKKWMLFSDYVIADKSKPNDVMTLMIIPYFISLADLKSIINDLQSKDIKHTKFINNEFISFVNDAPVLFVNILMNKNRKLDFFDEKRTFQIYTESAIKMLKRWCRTTPENRTRFEDEIKDLNSMQQELKKQSPNLSLLRDIFIVGNIVAYLMCETLKFIKDIEIIGWFSDRDKILDYKKKHIKTPLVEIFIANYFHILSKTQSLQNEPNLVFGLPEETGTVWYDECNRLCDYICGTIADYNLVNNSSTHNKFIFILEKLIASNDKFLIYSIEMTKKQVCAKRITVNKGECPVGTFVLYA